MGISGILAIPMIITCLLQGTLCDTGIPHTFYGGKFCSVDMAFYLHVDQGTGIEEEKYTKSSHSISRV
jgi:hypothetical protein